MKKGFWLVVFWPLLADAEIYKWTDAQGQVHFGERPPAGAEQLTVRPQVIERDPAMQAQQERADRWFDARREERAEQQTRDGAARAERVQQCNALRERLAVLSQGGRYFHVDERGEHIYHSEEQIAAARQALADRMSGICH